MFDSAFFFKKRYISFFSIKFNFEMFLFSWPLVTTFYFVLTLVISWARWRSFHFTPLSWNNKCNGIGIFFLWGTGIMFSVLRSSTSNNSLVCIGMLFFFDCIYVMLQSSIYYLFNITFVSYFAEAFFDFFNCCCSFFS